MEAVFCDTYPSGSSVQVAQTDDWPGCLKEWSFAFRVRKVADEVFRKQARLEQFASFSSWAY